MIKQSTFQKLYEDALKEAEKNRKFNDDDLEVEIVLVPVIMRKNKSNGKISSISGVNHGLIFEEEN